MTEKVYKVLQTICCKSRNVAYLITYKKCNLQYVDETEDHLNIRIVITKKLICLWVGIIKKVIQELKIVAIDHNICRSTEQRFVNRKQLKTIQKMSK